MSKIDSNSTGLRFAEEQSIGVLPSSPVWLPLEPNSYGEFGAEITTVARNPINSSRQRRKGMVTDLDATVSFQSDFVQESLYELMQGFFFADWRKKPTAVPSAVSGTQYTFPSTSGFVVNGLIHAKGFNLTGNNGLKVVTAATLTTVSCAGLTAETPPSGATIRQVGIQGASGDISAATNPNRLTSTNLNFTTLGIIPGEWIFIGGDLAAQRFNNSALNGFARVLSVSANSLVLDRTPGTWAVETGAGKTIRLFFGDVIRSEDDPALIKRRSYQMERSLDTAGFQYVKGCVPNTLEIKVSTADKVTVEMGFIGIDEEFTAANSPKSGTRPDLPDEPAFNSSSDFSRLRMLDDTSAATLFTYLTELNLTINNNVKPSKSISVLGAFDATAGDFVGAGSVTAYFASTDAVTAVRNNADVSLDFALVKKNAGWLFDVPLITLGDGRLTVEKDTEIKLPLTMEGAQHPTLLHTILAACFHYLPTLAE
jgi:hypothetical protein